MNKATAVSGIIVADLVQMAVFPTQASLEDKSFQNTVRANDWMIILCTILYGTIGVLGTCVY